MKGLKSLLGRLFGRRGKKKGKEGYIIKDTASAQVGKIVFRNDETLRLKIVSIAGFSIDEAYLVYQFVKGNDEALAEIKAFREYKDNKNFEKSLKPD